GPLLTFSVNDQLPGATVELPDAGTVRLRAAVQSSVPVERLELLAGGTVVAQTAAKGAAPPFAAVVALDLPVQGSTWLAARCLGTQPSPLDRRSPIFAHTTPVAVRVAGQPLRSPGDAAWLRENLRQAREWVEREGRFASPAGRERLLHVFDRAE